MKKIQKLVLGLVSTLILTCMTGCGDSNPTDEANAEPVNIAFVVGIADDETKINEGIEELSILPAKPGTDYAFIAVDGSPTCIGEPGTIVKIDRGYTETMMKRVREGIKADLVNKLSSYNPEDSELDMASSIDLAVRTINANTKDNRKNILVLYCGGKSTTGIINMLDTSVSKLDVDASVPIIAEKMNLDMANIDEITWYCCGEYGNKQPALSATEKDKLKDFYKKLFQAMGGPEVKFKNDLPSNEYYQFDNTAVSIMEVEECGSSLVSVKEGKEINTTEDIGNAFADGGVISFDETSIAFSPGTSEFIDEKAAKGTLNYVGNYLKEHPDFQLLVTGTTACAGGAEYCDNLSLERSNRICQLLKEEFGIDESQLKAAGVGYSFADFYTYDQTPEGELDERIAPMNRSVKLVDLSSDTANRILAQQ